MTVFVACPHGVYPAVVCRQCNPPCPTCAATEGWLRDLIDEFSDRSRPVRDCVEDCIDTLRRHLAEERAENYRLLRDWRAGTLALAETTRERDAAVNRANRHAQGDDPR
jgi:hypothetical protein